MNKKRILTSSIIIGTLAVTTVAFAHQQDRKEKSTKLYTNTVLTVLS